MITKWLEWARELQAIAQNGLTYCDNHFDIERYHAIQKISAEIFSVHTELPVEKITDILLREEGYQTPKIDVRGIVFRENKILLVKEVMDGCWTLPGGWADPNMTPTQNVEREVWEESGFEVKAIKLLAFYDRDKQGHYPPFPFHVYKAFFLCELTGGKATLSNETSGVEFFAEDEIPKLSESRVLPHQLKNFFRKFKDNDLNTEFD
ncbi:MAG: NUDIX domain-containing protein [Ignavibacteriales bacterium]|nr:MAG: NUDIX domain-containing protein [Ignavibacteriales bacterium]